MPVRAVADWNSMIFAYWNWENEVVVRQLFDIMPERNLRLKFLLRCSVRWSSRSSTAYFIGCLQSYELCPMAILRAQEASSSICTYDVFLSFRGEDTRNNFTDHLYTALVQAGYRTFRDDYEIERGQSLKPELDKAIKSSRISIIVFSKDYASSPWCLDELVVILECKRRALSGHLVLPVFYDVCPSEIRKQKGRTREAFDGYVEQYEAEIDHGKKTKLMEKVKGWKEALVEVTDLAGMELKNQADG
ncbi:hypothetical protein LguiA_008382 [Lonicera macranthoides]